MLDQLADYTIPVLHPLIVHFPIALSFVAVLSALVWLIRDKESWLHATTYLVAVALVGAFAAVQTGEDMKELSEGVAMVDQFVELHKSMGERAMWLLAASLLVLIGSRVMARRDLTRSGTRLTIRIVAFLFVAISTFVIALTADIGGTMTWGIPF